MTDTPALSFSFLYFSFSCYNSLLHFTVAPAWPGMSVLFYMLFFKFNNLITAPIYPSMEGDSVNSPWKQKSQWNNVDVFWLLHLLLSRLQHLSHTHYCQQMLHWFNWVINEGGHCPCPTVIMWRHWFTCRESTDIARCQSPLPLTGRLCKADDGGWKMCVMMPSFFLLLLPCSLFSIAAASVRCSGCEASFWVSSWAPWIWFHGCTMPFLWRPALDRREDIWLL